MSLAVRLFDSASSVLVASTSAAFSAAQVYALLTSQAGVGALEGEAAVNALRWTLVPLQTQADALDRLGLTQEGRADLERFLGGAAPSPELLQLLALRVQDVKGVLEPPSPPEALTTTARQLVYPGRAAQALVEDEAALRGVFDHIIDGARARAGVTGEIPPAISLSDVLQNPAAYADKELEIVLFDVDGTTHRGQYWLDWLLWDVLRYGPKNTTGLGIGRLIRALIPAIRLRRQEKKEGHADPEATQRVMGRALKGLEEKRVRRSFDRFYEVFGKRWISSYMRDEFAFHRAKERLLIGVSASPTYLVQRHADDMGIPTANVFGTQIEIGPDGKATGAYTLLRAGEKITTIEASVLAPLREKGIRFKIVAAYSDSDSDIPMFELTRADGGRVFATNSPREAFEQRVLREMRGTAVQEESGWPGNGLRRTIHFSPPGGERVITELTTPPERSPTLDDLAGYSANVGVSAGGLAIGTIITKIASEGVSVNPFDMGDVAAIAAGSLASGLGHFLTPKDDHPPWLRSWLLGDLAPLASAMYFASSGQPFSPIAFFLAAAASTLTTRVILGGLQLMAHGFGMHKFERFLRRRAAEVVVRPVQMGLYRLLYPVALALEKGLP